MAPTIPAVPITQPDNPATVTTPTKVALVDPQPTPVLERDLVSSPTSTPNYVAQTTPTSADRMAPDVPSKESSRNSQVGPSSIVKIQLPKTQAAVAIPANSDKKHQKPDKPEPMIAYLGGGGSSGVALPGGGTESSQLGYTLLASRVW
ncbi:hypothetical protein [Amylolactobacillus amylophilus]|uniref:hypothetical protein n=1 Tax=Amylolactobacillus amylophilus TaxID=1603 RepID=UPI002093CD58|nr:hypothetical protein [Amylolactobacillus amylophilus]